MEESKKSHTKTEKMKRTKRKVVYYQCCVLIGLATTRLYVIHCNFQGVIITPLVGLI